MRKYLSLEDRINDYRISINQLILDSNIKFQSSSDEREFYTVAQDRTLDEPFRVMISLYNTEGMETTYYGDQFYCFRHRLPFTGILHKHHFIEIFYVIDGFFEQILLGERYHFNTGEFVITDQNCEHSDYLVSANAAVFFLQIRADYLDTLLHQYDQQDELHRFLFHALSRQQKSQSFLRLCPMTADTTLTQSILEQLFEEACGREFGFPEISRGLLLRLLQHLCLHFRPLLNTDTQENKEKALLYEIERFIRVNYATVSSLTLEDIFHYHRNYYNQLLQKYRGVTFKNYLINVRLQKADELLHTTTLPIKDIIHNVGYENTSHFYHLYAKKYGHPPNR